MKSTASRMEMTLDAKQQQSLETSPTSQMDISVVIVSWNAKGFLEECLQSLADSGTSRSMEVIVVDNASADGSPEMVQEKFPQVKLIRNGKNLGFAKANNVGIRESAGRYVSLVNSDVKILGDCLGALVGYMDQHPDVGNVGPKILNRDLTLQSSCRQFPSLWNNFCEASGLNKVFRGNKLFSGEHMVFFPHDQELAVDVLVGCFWMVRRETFEQIGLLDEDFFIYAEDVDWCRRCWDAGWRVVFFPGSQAIHYRGGSSANDPERFAVEQQKAVLHYWEKHHGPVGRLAVRAIMRFRYALRYLFNRSSHVTKSSATKAIS